MVDERKVCGRSLQTRGPQTAELRDPYENPYSAPADSLCCILVRAKPYILIERNNWRGGKWPMLPPPVTGVWRRQTMLNYILHLQSASKGPFIATQLNSTSSWVASAGRYRHKPECKLQTVNVKPKSNNYRSSAECWSVAELNRAEAFGQIFGRCNQSSDLTSLLYVLLATSLVKFSRVLHFTWHLIGQTCHPKHGMPLLSVWPGSWNHWSHQRAAITNFKCWSN